MTRAEKERLERAEAAIRRCRNYGELERLAGVTDRAAFWTQYKHDEEDKAREALRAMIRKDHP